jgi:hypothetical protein
VATILEQIYDVVTTTPSRWQTLMATFPTDLVERQPKPDEWSAVECLRHLTDAEQFLWPVRVRAVLAGETFPPFSPKVQGRDYAAFSPSQLADEFARLRAAHLPLLTSITEADLERTGIHPDLGAVTMRQLLHTWAAHDLMHTVQAERALMQPFINETGPWRFFFADHDVAPTGANKPGAGE